MKHTLFTALTLATLAGNCLAGAVTVNGSTTVLPVMQSVAERFMQTHPGTSVSLSGGGSGHGIKALTDGSTDVAMSSRDLKRAERERLTAAGIDAQRHTVAIDAIVPVVHPSNTVANLSMTQLKAIYAGRITNWKDVGGPDARITIVNRDSASGTFESWESLVMKKERVSPRALLQASNGAVLQTVAKNTHAIGYVGLGYLGADIKPVPVNGVTPSMSTAENGTWPISRELYLFTKGAPAGDVKALVDFALSRDGQGLVRSVGFVPVVK